MRWFTRAEKKQSQDPCELESYRAYDGLSSTRSPDIVYSVSRIRWTLQKSLV
jgi:hypothetical protein